MSVAFRRESDEEHLEPRFELPIPPGPNPVTRRGLALIEERVAAMEAALRDMGPGEDRDRLARDLRYWRQRLATAEPAPAASGGEAAFGTRVRVRRAGAEQTVIIVGHDEADAATGRIAFTAPLARALIGAAPGESVALGGRTIEVLEVAIDD